MNIQYDYYTRSGEVKTYTNDLGSWLRHEMQAANLDQLTHVIALLAAQAVIANPALLPELTTVLQSEGHEHRLVAETDDAG